MKKLITLMTLAVLALGATAQAGEKAAKEKTTCSDDAKGGCCSQPTSVTKSSCAKKQTLTRKTVDPSIKCGTILARM